MVPASRAYIGLSCFSPTQRKVASFPRWRAKEGLRLLCGLAPRASLHLCVAESMPWKGQSARGGSICSSASLGASMDISSILGSQSLENRRSVWIRRLSRNSSGTVPFCVQLLSSPTARPRWSALEQQTVGQVITDSLSPAESMMSLVVDPRQSPELLFLRESIRAWRFYDHFRTDAEAPARSPQLGTYTPILVNDGADLAAAIQTIREIGDAEALRTAVEDAFPKSQLDIEVNPGRFTLLMRQQGLLRSLSMAEVSDGTLRFLLWIAALLTARPPELMVLNEPETSLHPDLIPALARLIVRCSDRCQMVIVSHATPLIDALHAQPECHAIVLEKDFGETRVSGANRLNTPTWHWPQR